MAQDLRDIYRKQMRHHGCGMAMYQPIAYRDIEPPCCGYFDENGKWNIIANLRSRSALSRFGLMALRREPLRMQQIGLRWQPKCSKGVRKVNIDLSGQTPDLTVPVSADAHIKYQSKKRFGAVLVARNPITLTAYNDESLFKEWIEDNKARLYELFSHQLKKYGLWVITTTYTAPGCSINAWMDSKTDAVLSAKAQADMAGEFGAELDWTDKLTDKDWCHYTARPANALRGSKGTSSIQSSIHRDREPDSRNLGSGSRSPDAAASSVNSFLVTPRQSSSPEAASNEGVVMFYNGHYADPLEWWVVGAKSVSTSIFGTKLGDGAGLHSHPRSGAVHCNTCIRVQKLAHQNNTTDSTIHRKNGKPNLSSSDDSIEVDYDPEKDEGVHPRYWPPRNPGLRTSRQRKSINSGGARFQHNDLGSRHMQGRDERHRRDGIRDGNMNRSLD